MTTPNATRFRGLAAAAACALAAPAIAQSIINGGFESGLSSWTTVNQVGSNGAFTIQSGTSSPVNGFTVPAPPGGLNAAMTDSVAGGAHALYQDIVVPAVVSPGTHLAFSLYLNNAAVTYTNPNTLDWAATNQVGGLNLNQQARVDIMTTSADPFSVGATDILANLFQTTAATPPVMGYIVVDTDVTSVLQAHQGETLRLRFAETDNVNFFNMGVDNVKTFVPAPGTALLTCLGLASVSRRRRSA